MNHRMAASAKNSEPMIALSWALTGKAVGRKPRISPGKSQQTAPATAKTMARIILIGIASPPYFHPTIKQASSNKVRPCGCSTQPKANESPTRLGTKRGCGMRHGGEAMALHACSPLIRGADESAMVLFMALLRLHKGGRCRSEPDIDEEL